MAEKVLVIDDDQHIVMIVSTLLKHHGYDLVVAYSAEEGLRQAYLTHPDLVILDIMMPAMDGWEVCRRLRELSDMPILFLSAKGDIRDVVKGLEMGADDYLIKPFDNHELVARVKAHLRRAPSSAPAEELVFDNGDLVINFFRREVTVRGKRVELTPKEFDLLACLVNNAGRVLSRRDLVVQAWGQQYADAVDSLKPYIHYLRKKLEKNPAQPDWIVTSRGVGYRFAGTRVVS
jgi:two-component system KDP operon response regulator KdpE